MPPKARFTITSDTPGPFVPPIITKKEITLLPHQIDHFLRCVEIMKNNWGYIDVSTMGRGKTYVLAAIAIYFNIPFMVICPNPQPWDQLDRDIDLKGLYMGNISYGKIAGQAGHTLSHNYLHRIDPDENDKRKTTEFVVTNEWIRLCRMPSGFMVVLDESHSIKNKNSKRSRAVQVLLRALIEIGENNRFAFLSATYFDKPEHARSFVMSMGFVKSDEMIRHDVATGEQKRTGIAELFLACDRIDPEKTEKVMSKYTNITGSNVNDITYDLYVSVIHKHLGSEMPDNLPKRNYRGFFRLSRPEDRDLFLQSVANLQEASQYNVQTNQVGKVDFEKVREALGVFGKSIVYDMCRFQIQNLRANPNCKVAFYMNNIEPVNKVREIMESAGYRCVVITGQHVPKQAERLRIKNTFLEDPNIRVIILTVPVGAQSLNLHNEAGFMPIISVCTPGYALILIHQASGRSNRTNQLSLPFFYMFYPMEQLSGIFGKILIRLAEKSEVVMSTRIASSNPADMPGGYPRFFEGHGFIDEPAMVDSPFLDESHLIQAIKNDNIENIRFMTPVNPPLTEISGMPMERLIEHVAKLKNINIIDAPEMIKKMEAAARIKYTLITEGVAEPVPVNVGKVLPPSMLRLGGGTLGSLPAPGIPTSPQRGGLLAGMTLGAPIGLPPMGPAMTPIPSLITGAQPTATIGSLLGAPQPGLGGLGGGLGMPMLGGGLQPAPSMGITTLPQPTFITGLPQQGGLRLF